MQDLSCWKFEDFIWRFVEILDALDVIPRNNSKFSKLSTNPSISMPNAQSEFTWFNRKVDLNRSRRRSPSNILIHSAVHRQVPTGANLHREKGWTLWKTIEARNHNNGWNWVRHYTTTTIRSLWALDRSARLIIGQSKQRKQRISLQLNSVHPANSVTRQIHSRKFTRRIH